MSLLFHSFVFVQLLNLQIEFERVELSILFSMIWLPMLLFWVSVLTMGIIILTGFIKLIFYCFFREKFPQKWLLFFLILDLITISIITRTSDYFLNLPFKATHNPNDPYNYYNISTKNYPNCYRGHTIKMNMGIKDHLWNFISLGISFILCFISIASTKYKIKIVKREIIEAEKLRVSLRSDENEDSFEDNFIKRKLKKIKIPYFLIKNSETFFKRATKKDISNAKKKQELDAVSEHVLRFSKREIDLKENSNKRIFTNKIEVLKCYHFEDEGSENALDEELDERNYKSQTNKVLYTKIRKFIVKTNKIELEKRNSNLKNIQDYNINQIKKKQSDSWDNLGLKMNLFEDIFEETIPISSELIDKLGEVREESGLRHKKPSEVEKSSLDNLCLICCDEKAVGVIMPCGHGGICLECGKNLIQGSRECFLCKIV